MDKTGVYFKLARMLEFLKICIDFKNCQKNGETFELFKRFSNTLVVIANNRIFLQQISKITANNNQLNRLHLPGITKLTFTWNKKRIIHTF